MQVLQELSTYSMNVSLSPLNLVFFLIIYIRRILTGCKIKPFLLYHIISFEIFKFCVNYIKKVKKRAKRK